MIFTRTSKRRLEIACPCCGHVQEEPALAISTYCRGCGEHFRIIKGAGVPDRGPRWSGVEWPEEEIFHQIPAAAPGEGEAAGSDGADADDAPADATPEEKEMERGLSEWIGPGPGAGGSPEEDSAAEEEEGKANKDDAGSSARPLASGSVKALIGELGDEERLRFGEDPDKMPPDFSAPWLRRRWKDSAEEGREVRCFRCHHVQRVPAAAASTQCARCSLYLSLADHEVAQARLFDLHTRGRVVVRSRGSVANCQLVCGDLHGRGRIDAGVDCSGELVIKRNARILGQVHCARLEVGREGDAQFPDGVVAGSVEVRGTLVGDVFCEDKVVVPKGGHIVGDVTAGEIEAYGPESISGTRTIDGSISASPPLNPAYNPAIIG